MGMVVRSNIMALNANRQLGMNNSSVSKSLEKLSSGFKINRAGDDASGLAISEKMKAQIKGLETASSNSQDGISLVQTAEGAMTEVHSMLNRMVELATKSANGTIQNQVDREAIQSEVNALLSEIDRIGDSTNFNGINLLDGSMNAQDAITAALDETTAADAVNSVDIGTESNKVNGALTKNKAEVAQKNGIYIGGISNTNATAAQSGTITLSYSDNKGALKTLVVSVTTGAAGDTVDITAEGIMKAIKGATGTATAVTDGVTAKGTAKVEVIDNGTAADGRFADLFDVSIDGSNQLVITQKLEKATGSGITGDLDPTKTATTDVTVAYAGNFGADDITDAEAKLQASVGGAAAAGITLGSSSGEDTAYSAAVAGSYTVASKDITMTAAGIKTNNALQVGEMLYIMQKEGEDLSDDAKAKIATGKAKAVTYDGTGNAAAQMTNASKALALAITADAVGSANGGFVATTTVGGVLTVQESANRGMDILNNDKAETQIDSVVKQSTIVISAATNGNTEITIDADKITDKTKVTVGGKDYTLVFDAKTAVGRGENKVVISKDDDSDAVSKKLADAINAQESAGYATTDGNGKITLADDASASASGAGLTLQVGDTNDSFNKVSVAVENMKTDGLGVAGLDVSTADAAGEAIKTIKDAINMVSTNRANLGALQNRLEYTINNLDVSAENMNAANSRIRDTDMAKQMMEYTKMNVLTQSAQAMLAQANQQPQSILQLLQ